MKLSYLNLTTTEAAYNLAVEQYVFERLPRDRTYFMLWQNDNAVIVGKHQNTLAEINEPYVRKKGIHVVRRLSGGGAVYHDMGNLNFTFITDAGDTETLDFHLFCQPVVRTLAAVGIHAEVSGRNDITIDGKKFSGNAQYVKGHRVMHHGTILFDSDLDAVQQALRPDPAKVQSKGVKSLRSRMTNVRAHLTKDIRIDEFRKLLLSNVLDENPGEKYVLTQEDLIAVERLRKERYAAWEWNYGASPECTLWRKGRIEGCGTVEVCLAIEHGRIKDAVFLGDFFSIGELGELTKQFIGHRPEPEEYQSILKNANVSDYFVGMNTEQLLELLAGA